MSLLLHMHFSPLVIPNWFSSTIHLTTHMLVSIHAIVSYASLRLKMLQEQLAFQILINFTISLDAQNISRVDD